MTNDIYSHLTDEDYANEEWRDITGYEGLYQVSNIGRVKSLDRMTNGKSGSLRMVKGRLRSPSKSGWGYLAVLLVDKTGNHTQHAIHKLVAESFLNNNENLPQVNHRNGIKTCNKVDNLEWITPSGNTQHAYDTGLAVGVLGEQNGKCSISDEDCIEIMRLYKTGSYYQRELAEIFDISRGHVSAIVRGTSRAYLKAA